MAVTKGFGTTGNGAGVVTPLDQKLAQAGLLSKVGAGSNLIRPGLFYDGVSNIVLGKANMSYDVVPFAAATTRGAAAGAVLLANDGVVNVATTAAPGSNSRIDVVYVWPREFSLDRVNSTPVIGVVQGAAAASPAVPSLAAFPGAIELARILVPAGVTATNTGTTITQTAPFTALDGGLLAFRNTTEMNAWTTVLTGQRALDLSTGITFRWNGSAWKFWESDWLPYTPTVIGFTIGTGGAAASVFRFRFEDGLVRIKFRRTLGTSGWSVGSIPTFSLPYASATPAHQLALHDGVGSAIDVSAVNIVGLLICASDSSTTTFRIYTIAATLAAGAVGASLPWTWNPGDTIAGEFVYEPA